MKGRVINITSIYTHINVPYEETDLPGIEVYHGTTINEVESVLAGPKNVGSGLGGKGIYLAVRGERYLADEFAFIKNQHTHQNPAILEGRLSSDRNLKVARIQIAARGTQPNLEKGIFPADWSRRPILQKLIHNNFDVVEVIGAADAGYAINSNRFLVITERAGKNAIHWTHINNTSIVPPQVPAVTTIARLPVLSTPRGMIASTVRFNPPLALPHHIPKLPATLPSSAQIRYMIDGISSKQAISGGLNGYQYVGQYEQYTVFQSSVERISPDGRTVTRHIRMVAPRSIPNFRQVATSFAKSALLATKVMSDISDAYHSDHDTASATIRGGIASSIKIPTLAAIAAVPLIGPGTAVALRIVDSIPDEIIAETIARQNIMASQDPMGFGNDYFSGSAVYMLPLIKKGFRAIDQFASYVNELPSVKKAANAIRPVTDAIHDSYVNVNDTLKKERQIRTDILNQLAFSQFYSNPKTDNNPRQQATVIILNEVDPKPLNLPATPMVDALTSLPSYDYGYDYGYNHHYATPNAITTTASGYPWTTAPFVNSGSQLTHFPSFNNTMIGSHNESSITTQPTLSSSSNDLITQQHRQGITRPEPSETRESDQVAQHRQIYHPTRSSTKPKFDPPLLSNYRLSVVAGGLGVAATLKGTGAITIAYIKGGAFFNLSVAFGPHFWATMGMGIGIGAAIAAPMLAIQYFHNKRIQVDIKRSSRSYKHSIKEINTLNQGISSLNDDISHDALMSKTQGLLGTTQAGIAKEMRRMSNARSRDQKKYSRAHLNNIKTDLRPKLKSLQTLRAELNSEKSRENACKKYQNKSPQELSDTLQALIRKGSLTETEVHEVEAIRESLIDAIVALTLSGKSSEAADLIKKNKDLAYYKKGNIPEFRYTVETDNHKKPGKTVRGDIRQSTNNKITEINNQISAGQNPVPSLNTFINYLNNKIKHHGDSSSTKIIEQDLTDLRNEMEDLKTKYSTYGNMPTGLNLNDLASIISGHATNANQDSNFWRDELKAITSNRPCRFANVSTEELKPYAKVLVAHNYRVSAFSEAMQLTKDNKYAEAKSKVNEIYLTLPDDKNEATEFNAYINYCETNSNHGSAHWFKEKATFKENGTLPSLKLTSKFIISNLESDIDFKLKQSVISEAYDYACDGNHTDAMSLLTKLIDLDPKNQSEANDAFSIFNFLNQNKDKDSSFWHDAVEKMKAGTLYNDLDLKMEFSQQNASLFINAHLCSSSYSEALIAAMNRDFEQANKILLKLALTLSAENINTNNLIKLYDYLAGCKNETSHFYLSLLEKSTELPSDIDATSPLLNDQLNKLVYVQVIQDIKLKILSGDPLGAKLLLDRLSPHQPNTNAEIPTLLWLIEKLDLKHYARNKHQQPNSSKETNNDFIAVFQEYDADPNKTKERQTTLIELLESIIDNDVASGQFDIANDYLNILQKTELGNTPSTKEKLISLDYSNQHSAEDFSFWHNLHPKNRDKDDTSPACTRFEKLMIEGNLRRIALSKEKLGLYYHAAKDRESIRKCTGEEKQSSDFALDYQDRTQINNAFFKPIQAIIDRHIQSMRPSKIKSASKGIMTTLSAAQTVLPGISGQLIQLGQSAYGGYFKAYGSFFLNQAGKDLLDIRTNPLRLGQIGLKVIQYPIEDLISTRFLSEANSKRVKSTRTMVASISSPVIRSATLFSSVSDLANKKDHRNKRFQSESTASSMLTIVQAVIDGTTFIYENYHSSIGQAIEDPRYYKNLGLFNTILDSVAGTAQLTWLRSVSSNLTKTQAVLSLMNVGHALHSSTTEKLAAENALRACLSNLECYQLIQQNKDSGWTFRYQIDSYLQAAKYVALNRPLTAEESRLVTQGEHIYILQETQQHYLHARSRTGKHICIQINPISHLEVDASYHYFNFTIETQIDLKHKMADIFTEDTLNNMLNIINSTFGLAHDNNDQPIVNIARKEYLATQIRNFLNDGDNFQVLDLTRRIDSSKSNEFLIHDDFRIPAYLAIDLLSYRLAAFAEIDDVAYNYHEEFSTIINDLHTTSPEAWRNKNWENTVKFFKERVINYLKNIIIKAYDATVNANKTAYLKIITNNYPFCGDWHRLVDDEYKLLVTYCLHQLKKPEECRQAFDNIVNIHDLLATKCDAGMASHALAVSFAHNKSLYQSIFNTANSTNIGLSEEDREDEILRLLDGKHYQDVIDLLSPSTGFSKRDYYLAKAYYELNDTSKLHLSLHTLINEPIKDESYYALLLTLLEKLLKVSSPDDELLPRNHKLLAMLAVCYEQLLTFNLSDHNIEAAKGKLTTIPMQLAHSISSLRRQQSDRYYQSNPTERANQYILAARQYMLDINPTDFVTHIDAILTSLSLLPDDEAKCVDITFTTRRP